MVRWRSAPHLIAIRSAESIVIDIYRAKEQLVVDYGKMLCVAAGGTKSKVKYTIGMDGIVGSDGVVQLFPTARNRGVRSAPFVVLIGANMPSVLAEVAFISNPRDEKVLRQESNRTQLARALFAGIEGYMKTLGSEIARNGTGDE